MKIIILMSCLGRGHFHSADLFSAGCASKAQPSFVLGTKLPWTTREK